MTSNSAVPADLTRRSAPGGKAERLHYLDWLRIVLILGVFLYHALKPFDALSEWHIGNAEQSDAVVALMLSVNPWGIPLFFLVAGAGSSFALRRRSNRQYLRERVARLAIPFIVGSILLTPLQKYLEALHKANFQGSFLRFIPEMLARTASRNWLTPLIFSDWGLHLWFLGFLFTFSLLALPVFRWLKRDSGKSFVSWLARLVERRGGILLFVIPLAAVRVLFQPFFPAEERGWLDFVYNLVFFILGHLIYSDDRFLGAVRRDRWLLFAGGVVALVGYVGLSAVFGELVVEWFLTFVAPWSIILTFFFTLMSWGWALSALYLTMTRLDVANKWLAYGNETIMPFYVLHQPVIIVCAFFVVQWNTGIAPKLLALVLGSLLVTLGLVELVVRRIRVLRELFGMKAQRVEMPSTQTR
jgi:glucan biosynthesis protein C